MKEVLVKVDCSKEQGELNRIWRSIGYDEINWTYTPIGKDIYRQIKELNDGPYYVRNHNAFTSGNQLSSPARGSTNCYREDEKSNGIYDWAIIDRVYDIFVEHNCKPMIELGFMPHHLSSHSDKGLENSWSYPPKDYGRWQELCHRFVLHLIDRYGLAEVRSWYFAVWNEPDGDYWMPELSRESQRKVSEYCKLYDYAAAGVLGADSKLRFGGPELAGSSIFLDRFLEHCIHGKNYVTGSKGSRLDFLSIHAKATGKDKQGRVPSPDFHQMVVDKIKEYGTILQKYPELSVNPLLLNEWDIDVGTIYGVHDAPDFVFRNNSYYPTFLCRMVKELLDVKTTEKLNIELFTHWAFYFHGKRCFEGQRELFDTYGIRKPVFNALEILASMGKRRLEVVSSDNEKDDPQYNRFSTVDALASRSDDKQIQVIVWHQVRDQYAQGTKRVIIKFDNLPFESNVHVEHYRIDETHSNAHTIWKALGRPDYPTSEELAIIKKKEGLEKYQPDRIMTVRQGLLSISMEMSVHGISLLILEPVM